MRITKVYTRTGDQGTTRLVGGLEVPKDDPRVEAYGVIDELNATVGLIRTRLLAERDTSNVQSGPASLVPILVRIQHELFNIGASLATPVESEFQPPGVEDTATEALEKSIDTLNASLSPLVDFVLPGGGPIGALYHLARTTCRRAERRIVTLTHTQPGTAMDELVYINRLSDWLFVAGRWTALMAGEKELVWRQDLTD